MRPLLVLPALAFTVAACARTPVPAAASTSRPWRPGAGVVSVECRWDERAAQAAPAALEAACQKDPGCGCATLGHSLLMESNGAVEARTLDVLDAACHRGVLVSCVEATMVEELCVRGTARPSPACEVLERQGRVRSSGAGAAEMQR